MKVMALPALLLLAACAHFLLPAAPRPTEGGAVRVVIHETWLGVTFCETRPSAWVRADVLLTPEGPQVVAHELDHLEKISAFASCAEFAAWRDSHPDNWMLMEASAFCASARTDTRRGRLTWDRALRMYGARLAHGYPFGLSEAEAEAEIRKICTEPPERAP
jgi:hypothetical protein